MQIKAALVTVLKKGFIILFSVGFLQQGIAQSQTPVFTSFYPTTAGSGDTVLLHGTGLSTIFGVHFGSGSVAQILSATDTLVKALCGVSGSSGTITLDYSSVKDSSSLSLGGFTWSVNPIIYSVTPITAKQGDTVTITGKFYTSAPTNPKAPMVSFGGIPAANVLIPSYNIAKAIVGSGSSGNIVVSNIYGGATTYAGFTFTYAPPTVTSFSPTTAGAGDYIIITGTNFIQGGSNAYVGSGTAATIFISSTSLKVLIGTNSSGSVWVDNGPMGGVSNILPGFVWNSTPIIYSVTPMTAGLGDTVTIVGKYLAPGGGFMSPPVVSFGGVAATSVIPITRDSIKVVLGNGATGTIVLNALLGNTTYTGFVFKTIPIIYSFSPTAAATGTAVIIKGRNFTGTTGVSFGGVAAQSFSILNDSIISAVVGIGASGIITVTNANGNGTITGFTKCTANSSTTNLSICSSMLPYQWNGMSLHSQGTYKDTLKNYGGCDSVAVLNLSVKASSFSTQSAIVCSSMLPYVWNGKSLNATGVYKDTLIANNACDSIATLLLTVTSPKVPYTDSVISYVQNQPPVSLAAVADSGFSLLWYNTSSGGLGGTIAPVPSTTTLGTTFYYVSETGACGESLRAAIKVIVAATKPVITSFSPAAAAIGTLVTISGINFSTTAANNIVYFGAVQAIVTAATATSLSVIVPPGATYQAITVTTNNFTAYSDSVFIPTFPSSSAVINTNSFASKITLSTGSNPVDITTSDLDGDGKPDLLVINNSALSVFRNISNSGAITPASFASKINFVTGANPSAVVTGDLDGDGKPDVCVINTSAASVSIYLNTSTPGAISLASPIIFYCGSSPYKAFIQDLNLDGKPDIAVATDSSYLVSILQNTSTVGNLSFIYTISLRTASGVRSVFVSDLDGDGKPEIIAANKSTKAISVFKNTSTTAAISFNPKIDFATNGNAQNVYAGDLDKDGKPDIVVTNGNDTISVLKNTSTIGTIAFTGPINFAANKNTVVGAITIGDLDGDSYPDIAAANFYLGYPTSVISVFKNKCTTGNILFAPKVDFATDSVVGTSILIDDFDGDGRPDLSVTNTWAATVSILRNQISVPIKLDFCSRDTAFLTSNLSGKSYQWQINTGDSFVNIPSSGVYYGSLTNSILTIYRMPTSFNSYQYRCIVDGNSSNIYTLKFSDSWTGNTSSAWETVSNWSCGALPDSNTDVIINSGTVVLSSNVTIKSLTISPGVNFTVTAPYTLTITH